MLLHANYRIPLDFFSNFLSVCADHKKLLVHEVSKLLTKTKEIETWEFPQLPNANDSQMKANRSKYNKCLEKKFFFLSFSKQKHFFLIWKKYSIVHTADFYNSEMQNWIFFRMEFTFSQLVPEKVFFSSTAYYKDNWMRILVSKVISKRRNGNSLLSLSIYLHLFFILGR